MSIIKENLNNFLPNGFETENKENYKMPFDEDLVQTGYERDVPDIVSGPNLNNLIDVVGKNTNILNKYVEYLNGMPINNVPTVNTYGQLDYTNLDDKLTKKQITNCLLEVPQMIKYTLADGTLTIKAGSVVIVPYGTEDLTTQYPKGSTFLNDNFKVYDTQFEDGKFFVWAELVSDIVRASSSSSAVYKRLLVVDITGNGTGGFIECTSGSGNTTSTSNNYIHYNTTSNLMSAKVDGTVLTDVITLPVIEYMSNTTYNIASITQVFNGMGYIGSTVWVDKGVKGLTPNGRNEDGSLNNTETITTDVKTRTLTNIGSGDYYVAFNPNITWTSVETYSYDEKKNMTLSGEADWSACVLGRMQITNSVITSFQPKLPFRAVDAQDVIKKSGDTMAEDAKLTFLNKSANSYIGISVCNKYADVAQSKPAVQEDYMYINCFDKNDKLTGEILTKHMTSGSVCTCVRGYGHSTGKQVMSELQVGVDVDGKAYATAPPSGVTNSIVTTTGIKKATNGYLKLGNGIIIQWGTFKATVEGTSTITFPTPFSNAGYAPFCRRHQSGDNNYENGFASSRTTTSFKVGTWKDYTYSWYAIGY